MKDAAEPSKPGPRDEGLPPDDARAEWLATTLLEAAEAAGIGVMVTTSGDGLTNVYASQTAASLFGRDVDAMVQIDPMTLFEGAERERLQPLADTFLAEGTFPPTVDAIVSRPDGSEVSLEIGLAGIRVDDKPAVFAFVADVTQSRLALESLKRSEARFRLVVESIPDAIFITRGTTVTYANPAFEALFVATPQPTELPLDVFDLIVPEDAPRLREQLAKLMGGGAAHAEYRMRERGGRALTLEVFGIAVELGGATTVMWLGHDVTRRRQLEGRLLQADRLAVLGTLAAGMAHAINNPLSYTLLNLEHVARRMRDLGTERDYYAEARVRLAEAHDGADRVAKVVRQMRALSRARSSAPGAVEIRLVLESVLAMVRNEVRHRGQLVVRNDPIPRVWAREGELEQAFLGLLLYVTRSLPEEAGAGREIRLVTGTDSDGNAVVTVSDDGPALPSEVRSKLFDPFASSETMGLGLAMCHGILTSLEGRIDVESGPERGTTFRIVLPSTEEPGRQESQRPMSVRPATTLAAPLPRARVLVIDDDPGVASTLRAMLEAHHEVKSVESAREGLRLLLGDEEFDIVFCDLVMPEISGLDLYCAVELNRPQRTERIVFMTGGVFTPEAERFLARVPNRRIEKPFSLARVEQLLALAVGPQTPPASAPGAPS